MAFYGIVSIQCVQMRSDNLGGLCGHTIYYDAALLKSIDLYLFSHSSFIFVVKFADSCWIQLTGWS